jgi:hypothetical protein
MVVRPLCYVKEGFLYVEFPKLSFEGTLSWELQEKFLTVHFTYPDTINFQGFCYSSVIRLPLPVVIEGSNKLNGSLTMGVKLKLPQPKEISKVLE